MSNQKQPDIEAIKARVEKLKNGMDVHEVRWLNYADDTGTYDLELLIERLEAAERRVGELESAIELARQQTHYWMDRHMDMKGRYQSAKETLHEITQQPDAPTVNNVTFIKWLAKRQLEALSGSQDGSQAQQDNGD